MTYSDQKRGYRKRARAAGKLPGKFYTARFVGVDGEGFSDGDDITVTMGNPAHAYRTKDHFYALLTDSDGHELYTPTGRLETKSCLDFLLHIRERDANAVPVVFGGSYDICHMLAFGVSRDDLAELLAPDPTGIAGERRIEITLGSDDYKLTYRPRKSLIIKRWPTGVDKYEHKQKKDGSWFWKLTDHDSVTVWDVWGFFQGSFVKAMDTWLPGDKDWNMIKKWKGNRKSFDRADITQIRTYNKAEVRCLADLMDKVRDSIRECGLEVTRWDGVGAVATAMYRKHDVKKHMALTPQEVFDAARVAYSGGHIEAMKVGFHNNKVHHYDVNSAYPDQFRNLPSLAGGTWRRFTAGTPTGPFTLVRVVFHFLPGLPFYPLFFRFPSGSIIYPERGCGWYWFPEFEAAREFAEQFGAFQFRVLEFYTFKPQFNERPFAWVETYFERRKALIEQTNLDGIPRGEEKTLKLGYNACYGKTAQQVGARQQDGEILAPSYFQLEWAGFVTAGCRAKLMNAAMQNPDAIISFATDGLFSSEPLTLNCPKEKILGEWEYKVHEGMTMVMPGVYWLHDAKSPGSEARGEYNTQHFSRGYDKEQMEDFGIIHDAWRKGLAIIELEHERMITLGNAIMSDGFWQLRGLFTRSKRELKLNGENSKRLGIAKRERPHRGMVATRPRDHDDDYSLLVDRITSEPFPIDFIDYQEQLARGINEPVDGSGFWLNHPDAVDAGALA